MVTSATSKICLLTITRGRLPTVVATSNWWGGQRVLIAPQWIKDVSWSEATLSVDLTRQAVKDACPYDWRRNSGVNRSTESDCDGRSCARHPSFMTVGALLGRRQLRCVFLRSGPRLIKRSREPQAHRWSLETLGES